MRQTIIAAQAFGGAKAPRRHCAVSKAICRARPAGSRSAAPPHLGASAAVTARWNRDELTPCNTRARVGERSPQLTPLEYRPVALLAPLDSDSHPAGALRAYMWNAPRTVVGRKAAARPATQPDVPLVRLTDELWIISRPPLKRHPPIFAADGPYHHRRTSLAKSAGLACTSSPRNVRWRRFVHALRAGGLAAG